MSARFRPGCIVRSTLAIAGVLFLPLSIWFAHASWSRFWPRATGLFIFSLLFLWLALDRRADGPLAAIDDLSGAANPDA